MDLRLGIACDWAAPQPAACPIFGEADKVANDQEVTADSFAETWKRRIRPSQTLTHPVVAMQAALLGGRAAGAGAQHEAPQP